MLWLGNINLVFLSVDMDLARQIIKIKLKTGMELLGLKSQIYQLVDNH